MKSGDRKAVQRSSCNSPILMPAYNRERKIMIYNLINAPNNAAILSGKSGMRPNLVSHHIWSSSRTCRRCPPSLWPSYREGASQQTAETSYNSNSRLLKTALGSAMPFVLRPLSAYSLYTSRSFPDTMALLPAAAAFQVHRRYIQSTLSALAVHSTR